MVAATSRAPRRLLLILSSERSGSTLTRVILGQHSRVVAPQELFLMRYVDYDTWRRKKSVAIESLVELFSMLGKPATEETLDRRFSGKSTREVYATLLGELPPDSILLDKTPAYANDGETLRRSRVLDPFYIWLLRHPLGVIESHTRIKREARASSPGWVGLRRRVRDAMTQAAALPQGGMTALARQRETKWVVQQTIIREFLATVPADQQVMLRFEELVRQPLAAIETLCSALEITQEDGMLEVIGERHRMNDSLGDPNFHKHTHVDPVTADQWRSVFGERHLTRETRRLMEKLGFSTQL